MWKIIKTDDTAIVILEDGSYIQSDKLSYEEFDDIINSKSEEEIFEKVYPEYKKQVKHFKETCATMDKLSSSKLLVLKGESVYWEAVSQLSLPMELVKAILDAEEKNDETLLETYKNFWTLMSLNPDERCRKNLFWFLNRNGLVLCKQGFFVAYRNACLKRVEEDGTKVWTDAHSGTTTIRLGEVTSMPRSKCDSNHDVTCSRGLHLGARSWLKYNYFGNQGLACLCNPADVTAVPPLDNYGKLRTCAYLPISEIKFDECGNVIPLDVENGFDCSLIAKTIYEGLMGTEEDSAYTIDIPQAPGINKETITDNLLDIAMKCITNRNA